MTNAVCSRCVLDNTVSDIYYDAHGVCNYCHDYDERISHVVQMDEVERNFKLNNLIERIKNDGEKKEYDCIVGVSGGVDSSWALVQAKKLGLRPLAVHMDNGWNSELAQNNIENLVTTLGVDLYTHVIEWSEYRGLMQAFFDTDVLDVELLYDNAMLAINYQLAKKYKVKWILSGCNMATEGVRVPTGWNWFKKDKKNIQSIARLNKVKIHSFPAMGTIDYIKYEFFDRISWLPFLDYFEFNKENVLSTLECEYGYKRYPYKHYESVFTRFYQGYILPEKFGIDKRKLHFSSLINSGQLTRDEACQLLSGIPYASLEELNNDKDYFLKKMNWSNENLMDYISRPEVPHSQYGSEIELWKFCEKIYKWMSKK